MVAGGERLWDLLECPGPEGPGECPYCADHSLLLSVFWLVVLVGGVMMLGMVVQFLQGSCR